MKSTISPTSVVSPLSRGLFTAAKNSVSRVKETTEKISKVSDKNQKFAMNFVEFFGSKKNAKILRKSLESIKKSLVSTLEITKALRSSLKDMTKMKKGRGGLFSGGGLFGGALSGLVGGGLTALFGKAALITLGVLAVGGLAALLYFNRDAVFNFLKTNSVKFQNFIKPLIDKRLQEVFRPQVLKDEDKIARQKVDDEFKKLLNQRDEGVITGSDDSLFEKATQNVITELQERADDNEGLAKKRLLRQINTLKGIDNLGIFDEEGNIRALTAIIGRRLTTSTLFENSPASYATKTNNGKLSLIRKEIADNNNNLVAVRSKMFDLLENGKPDADEKAFAIDLLTYIDALRSQDKELIESFTPPSSNIGNITDLNETVKQFQTLDKSISETNPYADKTLENIEPGFFDDTDLVQAKRKNKGALPKSLLDAYPELDPTNPRDYQKLKRLQRNSPIDLASKDGNIVSSNTPSGNSSGLFSFIPTKPLDGYNFSNITYGIVGA